ncbi:MAG: hypothetical protein HEQ39_09715 [Rhizobacter sp.]
MKPQKSVLSLSGDLLLLAGVLFIPALGGAWPYVMGAGVALRALDTYLAWQSLGRR